MSTAIYQKYRPQTFDDVVGHNYVKKVLLGSLKTGKLAHALLFSGPRGTGKTSIARLIAKSLNCRSPLSDGGCCGKCSVCVEVEKGGYIDLIEIDAASNRGIDEIRLLKEKVNFAPAEGKYKVYIIDEVHMLTKEAFNALLKTLEEPPEFVVFVLATTEPHKIPMTILSRVQRFDLHLASEKELTKKIFQIAKQEGVGLDEDAAKKIYSLSGGSFRDSESLISKLLNAESKKDRQISLKDVEDVFGLINSHSVEKFAGYLVQGDSQGAFSFLENLMAEGFAVDQLIYQTIEHLRTLLRKAFEDSSLDIARIVLVLSKLSEANSKLAGSVIQTLPIEIAIVDLSLDASGVRVSQKRKSLPRKEFESKNSITRKSRPDGDKLAERKTEKITEMSSPKEIKKDVIPKKDAGFDEISSNWEHIVESTKAHNFHLFAFLSKSRLVGLEGNKLLIEVGYNFHKQKIESISGREVLGKLFEQKFGKKYQIVCSVNSDLVNNSELEDDSDGSNESLVEEVFGDL